MAHEIRNTDKFGEVRANGKVAWHGLGVEISEGQGAEETFEELEMMWGTQLQPAFYQDLNGNNIQIPNFNAHVREDTGEVLGMVSDNYKVISNRMLAQFADLLAGVDAAVRVETAGTLRGGRRVFCLVKLPKNIKVTNEDVLEQYILISNAHDASAAFHCYPTSIRVVCQNTLSWSERDVSRGFRFPHLGDIKNKLSEVRSILGIVTKSSEAFADQAKFLASKEVGLDSAIKYFSTVYDKTFGNPLKKEDNEDRRIATLKKEGIVARWEKNFSDDPKQNLDGIRGTAWAALNAITQWHDHERGAFKQVSESDVRAHSNLFGTSKYGKSIALKQAVKLAQTV